MTIECVECGAPVRKRHRKCAACSSETQEWAKAAWRNANPDKIRRWQQDWIRRNRPRQNALNGAYQKRRAQAKRVERYAAGEKLTPISMRLMVAALTPDALAKLERKRAAPANKKGPGIAPGAFVVV